MTLSIYDGVMLAIVLWSVIHGAMKGMAWQLAPIASLVLGYLFAVPLSAATAQWFGEPPLNRGFAMVTMYLLVSLGVYLIARSLRDSLEKVKLLEFDRHLGAILGGVKGVLFTVVLTVALVCVSPSAANVIVHTESKTIAENVIHFAEPLLPNDVRQIIDPYLKPIEALPDDPPKSYAKQPPADLQSGEDVTWQAPDTPAPRKRNRAPIYADDPSSSNNAPSQSTRKTRRSKPTSEDADVSSDQRFSDPNENTFGSNPNETESTSFR